MLSFVQIGHGVGERNVCRLFERLFGYGVCWNDSRFCVWGRNGCLLKLFSRTGCATSGDVCCWMVIILLTRFFKSMNDLGRLSASWKAKVLGIFPCKTVCWTASSPLMPAAIAFSSLISMNRARFPRWLNLNASNSVRSQMNEWKC